MATITVGAQQFFYTYQSGNPQNVTLVLVHGAGGTHLNWPAELRRLPNTAVYALDLPGHGRSTPPSRTTIEAYVDDVLAFIEALSLERVVIVGHSMGGAIAQLIGLRQSPDILGLILIGTGAKLRVTSAILDQIKADFETAVATISDYAWAKDASEELVRLSQDLLAQTDPTVLYGDYIACNQFDVMSQLNEICVPTLVIGGTSDRLTPLKYSRYLADHIPQAQFAYIAGGGHMMALEQPQSVTAVIQQFLVNELNQIQ